MASTTPEATPADEPRTADGYRTTPDQENAGWPPGVPYIIGNEVCERFSFYGMRAILKIHLVALFMATATVQQEAAQLVLEKGGEYEAHRKSIAEAAATSQTHLFFAAVYAFPMIGALLADRLLGKYRTILYLSLVYCAGNAVLAFAPYSLPGMFIGLALIAIGSGGIKPCVSANVGDQFGKKNWDRVKVIFQAFYFSINLGSALATLLIPVTRRLYGPSVAFAIPGILMFIATVVFWMGRKVFVHVPPKPGGRIGLLDTLSSICLFMALGHFFFSLPLLKDADTWLQVMGFTGLTIGFLALGLYLFASRQRLQPDDGFLAITLFTLRSWFRREKPPPSPLAFDSQSHPLYRSGFWGPAAQHYGPEATEGPVAVFKVISVFFLISVFWALFDQKATTWVRQAEKMDLTLWAGLEIEAAQTIAANPFMVMALIPLLGLAYRGLEKRGIVLSPLRRITIGMFITALSFAAVALIQHSIDAVGPGKVSIWWQLIPYLLLTTGEVMVSVTGLEFAYTQAPKRMKSTVMGFWLLTVTVGNVLVSFLAGFKNLEPVTSFWIYGGLMVLAGLSFALRARTYVPRDYTQG